MSKQKSFTREELIECLKNISSSSGKAPTYQQVEQSPSCPSVYIFKKVFGSWKQALKSADFCVNNESRSYTSEELIAAIHKFKEEKGRVPTEKLMNQTKGYPSGSVYTKVFGSWKTALTLAGFDVSKIYSSPSMDKIKRYENSALLEFLKEYKKNFGEIPVPINWFKLKDKPRREIYVRRFGSWKNALLAAGFDAIEVEKLHL